MVGLIASFLIALSWSIIAIPLGFRLGVVDWPGETELKNHSRPTPSFGGVGVLVGSVIGLSLSGESDWGLAAAGTVLLVVGLFDDVRGLPPSARLAMGAVTGVLLAFAARLPMGFDGAAGSIVVVVLVVGAVNAVNLLDGLDGLAASVGSISALGLAALAAMRGESVMPGLVLAAALGGFLFLNRPPARIFLGDNGAYVVGVLVSYAVLRASPEGGWSLILALGALGVFLVDLIATIVRRIGSGAAALFEGDRAHIYDQLRARGMGVPAVVRTGVLAQLTFVVITLLIEQVGSTTAQAAFVVTTVALVVVGLVAGGFLSVRRRGE